MNEAETRLVKKYMKHIEKANDQDALDEAMKNYERILSLIQMRLNNEVTIINMKNIILL